MRWDVTLPVLKGSFQKQLGKEFTDEDWLHCFHLGSFKTRFEIFRKENGELRYFRAIQCHSGGMIISPRLMNYVLIPYRWKRVIYHVGRARDQYTIAEAGLVAGGKERKEGRQTIFFTPLDSFNSDADEAESITDFRKPRKVHCQIHWIPEQDAVYWIHLSTAQKCWTRILSDWFSRHFYIPVCAKRMRRKGCQRKWKEIIVSKMAHTSRTTKSKTQTIMGS